MKRMMILRLQNHLAACAVLWLMGGALQAQTPAAAPGAAAASSPSPAPAWKAYTYSSEWFSVSFPSEPTIQKNSVPTDSGTFELRAYLAELGSAAFYVGICDYGQAAAGRDPQTVLTGAKEGAIGNVKAHILTENKVTLGTYPGVTFEAENDSMHFSASIYLVGTTLYQTLTAAPLKDRFAESAHFMNSFMLIPRIAQ